MNSYFQLIVTPSGTGLQLFPPKDGGAMLDINEVINYLQLKRIQNVDNRQIYMAIQNLRQDPVVVPLCPAQIYPEHEMGIYTVSEDKMTVSARFYAPSSHGNVMSREDLMKDLAFKRIVYGIKEDVVGEFLKNREYCKNIVIAEGVQPRHGTDAWIEYFFETNLQARPTRMEDGSVDFFHLNTINHCKTGDLLAKLHPEDKGDYGVNVVGEKIKPREVMRQTLKFGRNIELSEDRTEIRSSINGHVMLTGDKVFVSDIYEVENVGTATGNITSEGSVNVSGNVQSGFSIQASGNVEVKGVVEGATIIAGGDIIIDRGMNGMGKGILRAGGSIIAKFVENATIEAGTYVEADSIMHSRVSATTEITVDGKKGFIAGGVVRATNKISCKTLGSEMGADTVVEVGVDPKQKARFVALQKEVMELQKKYSIAKTTLNGAAIKLKAGAKLTAEQMKYVQSLAQACQQMEEQLAMDNKEFQLLEEMLANKANACVCVRENAYAGTKIVIGEDSLTLKGIMKYCRFMDIKGEVKATTF